MNAVFDWHLFLAVFSNSLYLLVFHVLSCQLHQSSCQSPPLHLLYALFVSSQNRYGIVHFNLSESAQRALSVRRHWFPGCQLIVRPHRPITKQRKSPGLRDAPKMDTDNDQEDNSSYEMLFQRMLELDDVSLVDGHP